MHPAHSDDDFENEILDLPVAKVRRGRGAPIERVDAILENVLDALPEPKASGQGRSRGRGRRVTTGPISTSESALEASPAPSTMESLIVEHAESGNPEDSAD